MATETDISGPEWFDFDIVGESNYQRAIMTAAEAAFAAGERRAYLIATIHLDDGNPYDSKAVEVRINDRTVGYLDRDDARRYRRWKESNNISDPATCRSVIVKGGNDGAGVWLDLPLRNT